MIDSLQDNVHDGRLYIQGSPDKRPCLHIDAETFDEVTGDAETVEELRKIDDEMGLGLDDAGLFDLF